MKKIILALFTMLFAGVSVFAQSDLQVLAVVKYNKSESVTVKQLKKRVGYYEKQLNKKLSVDERKEVLNTLIEEKLVVQAAQKSGFAIPDSVINQYFEANLSQLVGAPVTEKQFEELVKSNFGLTVDEFFTQQLGLTKNEFKENLKTQLIMQQYVVSMNQAELQNIAPNDTDIRMFYESNKGSFIWNDMAKMLIVSAPKDGNGNAAKVKLNELRNKLKDKKITPEQLKIQSKADNSGFIAGEGIVEKSQRGSQMLGISMKDLLGLFSQNIGFVSDIIESSEGYSFISIIKKYDAKMLSLSDLMQPETTITVYDYIRAGLTQQLQGEFLQKALEDLAEELNTSANVDRKKTGASLDKLLDWGD